MNKDEISGILEACKFLVLRLVPLGLNTYGWDQDHKFILFAASEAIEKADPADINLLNVAKISTFDLVLLKKGLQFYLDNPSPLS